MECPKRHLSYLQIRPGMQSSAPPEEWCRTLTSRFAETTGKKKLCASRPVWYNQEQRLPAPILCSYMGRGDGTGAPVRFILNESAAIAANSFLMLYPKGLLRRHLSSRPQDAAAVWERLRAIPPEEFRRAGRCYGGGLQKMEPRELGDLDCTALRDWLAEVGGNLYSEDDTGQMLLAMEPDTALESVRPAALYPHKKHRADSRQPDNFYAFLRKWRVFNSII